MDLVTFLVWILIAAGVYVLSLMALKFATIRVLFVSIAFLPIALMLSFFIFRIPPLRNEAHKTEFFTNWKIGGHRGSSHDGIPENSLQAMTAAKNEGGQLTEFDIRTTTDGVPVISHDSNVARVTGVNREVSKMSLMEFKQLKYLGTNTTLPTLSEAINHCVSLNISMMWDLKEVDEKTIGIMAHLVQVNNLYSKVIMTGFNPIEVYQVKLVDPKILTGITWRSWEISTTDESALMPRYSGFLHGVASILDVIAYSLAKSLILPKFLGSDMIFYHVNDVNRFLALSAHENNMYLGTWTSNNLDEMTWLGNYLKVPFLTDNVSKAPTSLKSPK